MLDMKNSLRSIFLARSDQSYMPRADTRAICFNGAVITLTNEEIGKI